MGQMARENRPEGALWPTWPQGVTYELSVNAAEAVVFVDIGAAPDAGVSESRMRIAPMTEYFFTVPNGGTDKVDASGSSTGELGPLTQSVTTGVRVFYDDVSGVVEVTENGSAGEAQV